jgi:fatty acid desaturase
MAFNPLHEDNDAFVRDLTALRAEIEASLEPADFAHLRKIERWGRGCTLLGHATAWLAPNPLSALLLARGVTTRWTVVMHHVAHGGYDRVPGVPARYTSRGFAVGRRRLLDWLDWIVPEAWRYEHNTLHHARTGELADPDLVEENTTWLRRSRLPLWVKYAAIAFYACTWKLTYYAPNTFQLWSASKQGRQADSALIRGVRYAAAFDPRSVSGRAFWKACVLPYALLRFVLVPSLFLVLGPWAFFSVLANLLAAELLANVESFFLITPNHAGEDLYRFESRAAGRARFCVRQVVGCANYTTGGDFNDFLHGWLNYHIEHHLWPDLPLRKYQQFQPRVQALCERHGIPYVQESLPRRARKLMDIIMGRASMRPLRSEVPPGAPDAASTVQRIT